MEIFNSVVSTFLDQDLFWTNTYDDLSLELARRVLNKEGICMLSKNDFLKNLVNENLINVFDVGPQVLLFQYQDNSLALAHDEQQFFPRRD
jgi:hypothetical protein